ncbi:MAG: DJ-1/PfpI family protein [Clostridiales bacterium]|nr:DJ-1/PfpI family protein [Clostridiales bacterium]
MVYILLGKGFETIEALAPCDVMRRAGIEVAMVSLTDNLEVVSGQGIKVLADITLDQVEPDRLELLMLPGGLGGVEAILNSMPAMVLIQKAAERGKWVCAICAAPTILAQLGLLDRRKAVVYPGLEDQMFSAVVLKGERVVSDGRFITGEAAGSCIDFGLRLVEVLKGTEIMEQIREGIHYHG